jgi:hypothetical protein
LILTKFFYNLFNKIKKLFKEKDKSKTYKKINDNNIINNDIINDNSNYIINNNSNDINIVAWIKCKNYDICNILLPNDWYNYTGSYLCYGCECLFGKWRGGKGILNKFNIIKCPICLEYKNGVSQPRCEHYLCIDCMKRCYYGEKIKEPIFPYSNEIKIQHELDPLNNKWDIEYPLIKVYLKENTKFCDERFKKYKKEIYLRKCHLCRK